MSAHQRAGARLWFSSAKLWTFPNAYNPIQKVFGYHNDVMSNTITILKTLQKNCVIHDVNMPQAVRWLWQKRQHLGSLSDRLWNCANYTKSLHRVSELFFTFQLETSEVYILYLLQIFCFHGFLYLTMANYIEISSATCNFTYSDVINIGLLRTKKIVRVCPSKGLAHVYIFQVQIYYYFLYCEIPSTWHLKSRK